MTFHERIKCNLCDAVTRRKWKLRKTSGMVDTIRQEKQMRWYRSTAHRLISIEVTDVPDSYHTVFVATSEQVTLDVAYVDVEIDADAEMWSRVYLESMCLFRYNGHIQSVAQHGVCASHAPQIACQGLGLPQAQRAPTTGAGSARGHQAAPSQITHNHLRSDPTP